MYCKLERTKQIRVRMGAFSFSAKLRIPLCDRYELNPLLHGSTRGWITWAIDTIPFLKNKKKRAIIKKLPTKIAKKYPSSYFQQLQWPQRQIVTWLVSSPTSMTKSKFSQIYYFSHNYVVMHQVRILVFDNTQRWSVTEPNSTSSNFGVRRLPLCVLKELALDRSRSLAFNRLL